MTNAAVLEELERPLIDGVPAALDGAVVLVTGGTGSFGQAFVRRLLSYPKVGKIIVFSRDEQKHYRMQGALTDRRLRFFVGDIRDRNRLMRALGGVDVVVHAAAMKHVPIAEYNPLEAIRTNVDGAANLIDAAVDRGVKRVVGLSTDKAVNPANLYGATKLCMEKLLVAANSYGGSSGTRFDLVRYGNVVGSQGSVVPLFLERRSGGVLQLTVPEMTRFWIGMERAIDLVLLALAEGRGGEVFIPKLPACSVDTLAKAIAPDARHEIVGVRPGEKLHEALITPDEARNVVEYARHFVIRPTFPWWGGEARSDGSSVPHDFSYTSASTHQLTVEETRALLIRLGFAL